MKSKLIVIVGLAVVLGVMSWGLAESPSVLLEKGIFNEETKGDLDTAIKIYRQIVDDSQASRSYVAEAQYRLGICFMKQKKNAQAAATFRELIKNFPSQKQFVAKAKNRLRQSRKKISGSELAKIVKEAVLTISTCDETDPRVKPSLALLKGLNERATVKAVAKFLNSDKDTVRRSAIYILWKGPFKTITPSVPEMMKLCEHKEGMTRGMAALALGGRKIGSAFQVICKMTLDDKSPYARRCAAYALGLLGNPAAKSTLKKALSDGNQLVSHNAKAALAMFAGPDNNGNNVVTEIVGCRIKRMLNLHLKAIGQNNIPHKQTVYETDLLGFTWSLDPKLTKQASHFAVVVVPGKSKSNINDPASHTWSTIGIPAEVRSTTYGQVWPDAINQPAKVLSPGSYTVYCLAYAGKFVRGGDRRPIAGSQIDLTVKKPHPYTQVMIHDIQPDGLIRFRSVLQHINTSSDPIKTMGFKNSDFVHVEKMTDEAGKPIKFTSKHVGRSFRYKVTFNKPFLPGKPVLYSISGTMSNLIRQMTQDELSYRMRHWPSSGQPTRRIEIHRLPAGAALLKITPASLTYRVKNERVEIFVDKIIAPSGSLAVSYDYALSSKISNRRPPDQTLRILPTNPVAFANNVDPKLNKITVTFNQTLRDVKKIDRGFASWFRPEGRYNAASESEKAAMVRRWIVQAESENFKIRTRAIAALGNVRDPQAVDVLIRIAEEPMRNNRPKWLAVRGLGEIGNPRAVPTLIELVDHGNWNTNVYARAALAQITGVYFGTDKTKWRKWWKTNCKEFVPKTDPKIIKAKVVASDWLKLIDESKYGESWDTAAGYFKKALKRDKWQATINAVRPPLGKLISRKLLSAKYKTSLPGAPDGEYVVIQYQTTFGNKKNAIETVTVLKGKDGKWRVSGYFIK